jgi:DNA-binding transcriptional LysR family regulator
MLGDACAKYTQPEQVMAINLRHLRLFAAVVDHGGFTKAAAQLGLSQPAISKSLAELERSLHVRLIDRSGRSAQLTAAGQILHARAREIFGVERLAERELREIRGLKRGRLRVAASLSRVICFLRSGDSTAVVRQSKSDQSG